LEVLYCLTAPRKYQLSYSALKTNEEESTPALTQNHHGCLVTSNDLPANNFFYLRSEIVRNVILTKFVCCPDSDLLYISKQRPYITTWHRIDPTMPTVLWETALLNNQLRGAVGVDHVMARYCMLLFGSSILHANIPLKNDSSEFVLLCKKAASLQFIQATSQLVLSASIGNCANKVACFSHIISHPIAKSHVKPWSVREHYATWVRLFLPFVFEQLRLI